MKKYNMITPEGTKDVLLEECICRRNIEKTITSVFRSRGYNEVITPGIEYFDVFDLDGAGIPQYEMYKSADNKGRLLAFRPDLTLPIARLTATRLRAMKAPLRLFYSQPIWRNRPDLSGRNDESTQAGIELLGAGGIRADIEAITTAVKALSVCTEDFRIEIGHAAIFRLLADKLHADPSTKEDIRERIESKNYGALNELLDRMESSRYTEALKKLPRLFGGQEVFEEAAGYCFDPDTAAVLKYLKKLYTSLKKLGLGDRIIVDLGLVQRNDYYTGVVFSAYAYGHGDAILMGGRYDGLLAKFGADMPAVGFSMDVDAVTAIAMSKERPAPTVPDILVHGDEGFEIEAQIKLDSLAEKGRVCVASVFSTREEARRYAEENNIPEIIFVGKEAEE